MMSEINSENSLVSIIIPVWNTEKYLPECLDSVLLQTYSNLEIILINDGSTDNSLKICLEYQKKDNRIIVIDKLNSGVSDTRNVGLKKASGDYVLFIDSDDLVLINHVELLISTAYKYKSDITIGGLSHFDDGEFIDITKIKNKDYESYQLSKVLTLKKIIFHEGFSWEIANKLYSKSCLNEVFFDINEKLGEDLSFFCKAILNSNIISVNINNTYFYRSREDSATKDRFLMKRKQFLNIREKFISFNKRYFPKDIWISDCLCILTYFHWSLNLIKKGIRNRRIENFCMCKVRSYLFSVIISRKIPCSFKLKVVIFSFSINLFLLVSEFKKFFSDIITRIRNFI